MTALVPWEADAAGLAAAVAAVARGGVIGLPTDTVYGLACAATSPEAVAAVYRIKGRPEAQPLILMAASIEEVTGFVTWTGQAARLAARFWPGPLTLILPARQVRECISKNGALAVRIPGRRLARELLATTGPLATTSANRHGYPPVPDAQSALLELPGLAGALKDRRPPRGPTLPSSILDLTRDPPALIREGRLSARELGVPVPE